LSDEATMIDSDLLIDCNDWKALQSGNSGELKKIPIEESANWKTKTFKLFAMLAKDKAGKKGLEEIGFEIVEHGRSGKRKKSLVVNDLTFHNKSAKEVAQSLTDLQNRIK